MRRVHLADPLEFARRQERIETEVPVAVLPRLLDALSTSDGVVRFAVEGQDADGTRFLRLSLRTELHLQCQRCLKSMAVPLAIDSRLMLVPPGREMPDDDLAEDDFDPIVAERELDLLALVEEELLLGLPLAPRHERCDTPHPRVEDDSASPFAALAKLRGAGRKN